MRKWHFLRSLMRSFSLAEGLMGTQKQSVKSSQLRIACSYEDLSPRSEPMDGSRTTFQASRALQRKYP